MVVYTKKCSIQEAGLNESFAREFKPSLGNTVSSRPSTWATEQEEGKNLQNRKMGLVTRTYKSQDVGGRGWKF